VRWLDPQALLARRGQVPPEVSARVAEILAALRQEGGPALLRYARELDGAETVAPASADDMRAAYAAQEPRLQQALRTARARLHEYQVRTVPQGFAFTLDGGGRLAMRVVPLHRVGICVPGGRAPYPSTLLMAAVAARAAGVAEVIACSPRAHPLVLAAGHVAGVDAVYPLGGAQAVGAMAYGVPPVPRVDKVVGPGGPYVVEAKRQVFGAVGVESLPGPSEIVVVGDETADPDWVRADLLAQAEHGHEALVVLVTPSRRLGEAVGLDAVLVGSLAEAVALVNRLAPEHVSLQCADAGRWAAEVHGAGLVCVGPWSPVAAADYAAGTNHILPTEGTARFSSGLSAADFCRRVQVWVGAEGADLGPALALAEAEGFVAHAESIQLRMNNARPAPARAASSRAYVPEAPAGAALLDLNENPYPWPAEVLEDAVARVRRSPPNRYPRADADRLAGALAEYARVPVEWLVVANGGDELIMAAMASLVSRVRRVVFPTPTFGMYRRAAEALGLEAVGVPLRPDWSLDAEAVAAAARGPGESLLILCRPNNPTGNVWPREQVLGLCELPGVWPVVDEAYWEFAGENLTDALREHPRLLLLRTMSKAFGAAGLRVGYAIGAPERLTALRAVSQPWAVGRFDQAGAEAALAARSVMLERVQVLARERDRLVAALAAYPSRTNFVLFRVGPDAAAVQARLRALGVAVRRYPDPELAGCLRVSVGTPEENDRFLAALKEVRP
jgi:histidinol dehydrogenase